MKKLPTDFKTLANSGVKLRKAISMQAMGKLPKVKKK
jgi:hypothetical protein